MNYIFAFAYFLLTFWVAAQPHEAMPMVIMCLLMSAAHLTKAQG